MESNCISDMPYGDSTNVYEELLKKLESIREYILGQGRLLEQPIKNIRLAIGGSLENNYSGKRMSIPPFLTIRDTDIYEYNTSQKAEIGDILSGVESLQEVVQDNIPEQERLLRVLSIIKEYKEYFKIIDGKQVYYQEIDSNNDYNYIRYMPHYAVLDLVVSLPSEVMNNGVIPETRPKRILSEDTSQIGEKLVAIRKHRSEISDVLKECLEDMRMLGEGVFEIRDIHRTLDDIIVANNL